MIKYIFAAIYNSQKYLREGNENITLRMLFFSTVCTILVGIILSVYIFDITPSHRLYNLTILAMCVIGFAVDYWAYIKCVRDNQYKSFVKESRYNMLYTQGGDLERMQCAFISTDEVDAICEAISTQVGYPHAYQLPEPPHRP